MVHYGAGTNSSYDARIGKLPEEERAAALHARSTSLSSDRTHPNRLKIEHSNTQNESNAEQKKKYLGLHPEKTEKTATQRLVKAWVAGKGGWKYAEHATKK